MSTKIREEIQHIMCEIGELEEIVTASLGMLEDLNDTLPESKGTNMSKDRQIVLMQKVFLEKVKNGLTQSLKNLDDVWLDASQEEREK